MMYSFTNSKSRVSAMAMLLVFVLSFALPRPVLAQDILPVDPTPEAVPTEPVAETPSADPAASPAMTPSEVVEALPEGVDLVVVDPAGDPVPLASQKAAEIVALPDPSYVCSGGTHAGTQNFTSIQGAINDMLTCVTAGGTVAGALTVAAGAYNEAVILNSAISGFTGITGAGSGTTSFKSLNMINQEYNLAFSGFSLSDYMYITSGGDISLSDIVVSNGTTAGHNGIDLGTSGNITLTDVTSNNSQSNGIRLAYANQASLTHVTVNNNHSIGLYTTQITDLILDGTATSGNEFNGNGTNGIYVNGANDVTANYVTVKDNNQFGMYVSANAADAGDISLNHMWVEGNNYAGIMLESATGKVYNSFTLDNSTVTDNGNGAIAKANGVYVKNTKDVTITNSDITKNGLMQLFVLNTNLSDLIVPTVTLENLYLEGLGSQAGWDNIEVMGNGQGTLTATNVETTKSKCAGFYLEENTSVIMNNVTATENGQGSMCAGIDIYHSHGDVTLSNITANDNKYWGIYMAETGSDVAVSISDSTTNNNGYNGTELWGDPTTVYTINNLTAKYNGPTSPDTTPAADGYGLYISGGDTATLTAVDAQCNTYEEVMVDVTTGSQEVVKYCVPEVAKKPVEPASTGMTVSVHGGELVPVDCGYAYTVLDLGPKGKALYDGFCGMNASLNSVSDTELPGALPEGMTFGAGMVSTVEGGADGLIPDNGSSAINLKVEDGKTPIVLWWDASASKWVEIPTAGNEGSFSASNPAFAVQHGASVSGAEVNLIVNFTGIFVVAYK